MSSRSFGGLRLPRGIQELLDEARTAYGASVVSLRATGSGHFLARLQRPDGATATVTFSHSPSCPRTRLNERALLRRVLAPTPPRR